jgi:molybdate transport system substrate-binding protein
MFFRLVLILLCIFVGNERAFAEKHELMVSAAMSLKDVLLIVGKKFEEKNPDSAVRFQFAGSGQLRMQLEQGAPADVFLPAAFEEFESLSKRSLLLNSSIKKIATNRLMLVFDARKNIRSCRDLLERDIKRVAMGSPDSVPAGRFAKETLLHLILFDALRPKLVFLENVRQVQDLVLRGDADAGFVFATDVRSSELSKKSMGSILIEDKLHSPIVYGAAVLKGSKNRMLAERFLNFLQTDGASVFRSAGFGLL